MAHRIPETPWNDPSHSILNHVKDRSVAILRPRFLELLKGNVLENFIREIRVHCVFQSPMDISANPHPLYRIIDGTKKLRLILLSYNHQRDPTCGKVLDHLPMNRPILEELGHKPLGDRVDKRWRRNRPQLRHRRRKSLWPDSPLLGLHNLIEISDGLLHRNDKIC